VIGCIAVELNHIHCLLLSHITNSKCLHPNSFLVLTNYLVTPNFSLFQLGCDTSVKISYKDPDPEIVIHRFPVAKHGQNFVSKQLPAIACFCFTGLFIQLQLCFTIDYTRSQVIYGLINFVSQFFFLLGLN
jgi:hypothetical protein